MSSPTLPLRNPEVGDHYTGWGKSWEVVRTWPDAKVAEIKSGASSMRLPFAQFKEMTRG